MDIKQEHIEATAFWNSIAQGDKEVSAVLAFAESRWASATIEAADGSKHAASTYAEHIYINADAIVNDNPEADPSLSPQLQICAILVALQETCSSDSWSYGARLLFDLKKSGVNLKRKTIAALLAQEGSWESNRNKTDLMTGNFVATGIYCGRLKALCQSLIGKPVTQGGDKDGLITAIEENEKLTTHAEVLRKYLTDYGIPYLDSVGTTNAQARIDAFLEWLGKTDFYEAPSSHLSVEGGLSAHTINVLLQLIWQSLPANKQQIGACVLSAIGHDLCEVGVAKKEYKSKKVYLGETEPAPTESCVMEDQGGRFYWANAIGYTYEDRMPFGHGRKSAYMLMGFFPEIDETVFCAVDGHTGSPETNPNYLKQLSECPLALNLHLADTVASCLLEY